MTKADLYHARDRLREVTQLRERLDTMEGGIYSPKGQQLSRTPRGGGGGRTMEDIVAAHGKLQERYYRQLRELLQLQLEIEQACIPLPPMERMVIRARYVEGKSWDVVAKDIGYEAAQTHRFHSNALRLLAAV